MQICRFGYNALCFRTLQIVQGRLHRRRRNRGEQINGHTHTVFKAQEEAVTASFAAHAVTMLWRVSTGWHSALRLPGEASLVGSRFRFSFRFTACGIHSLLPITMDVLLQNLLD